MSDFTACPECGAVFESEQRMHKHLAEAHGLPDSEEEPIDVAGVAAEYEQRDRDQAQADESSEVILERAYRPSLSERLGDVVFGLWGLAKWGFGLLILVLVMLGLLGVFDKSSVEENASDPGYDVVRGLRASGTIDEFRAVEPEEGWTWEYELDDSITLQLRERGTRIESQLEFPASAEEDADAISRSLRSEGFR